MPYWEAHLTPYTPHSYSKAVFLTGSTPGFPLQTLRNLSIKQFIQYSVLCSNTETAQAGTSKDGCTIKEPLRFYTLIVCLGKSDSSAPAVSPHVSLHTSAVFPSLCPFGLAVHGFCCASVSTHLVSATKFLPFFIPRVEQFLASCLGIPTIWCLQTELPALDIIHTHHSMAITDNAANDYHISDLPDYKRLGQESITHCKLI